LDLRALPNPQRYDGRQKGQGTANNAIVATTAEHGSGPKPNRRSGAPPKRDCPIQPQEQNVEHEPSVWRRPVGRPVCPPRYHDGETEEGDESTAPNEEAVPKAGSM